MPSEEKPTTPTPAAKSFSAQTVYDIQLPDPESKEGFKTVTVRWPSDEEWCRRQRSILSVQRAIGRDSSVSDSKGEEQANLEMIAAIRRAPSDLPDNAVFEPDPLDPSEAIAIINRLLTRTITEVEKQGNKYRISMRVTGGITVSHTLKILTSRQMAEYGNAAVKQVSKRGGTVETRVLLEPTAELWDRIMVSNSGYVPNEPVPITHKDATLTELLMQIRQEMDGGPDPED